MNHALAVQVTMAITFVSLIKYFSNIGFCTLLPPQFALKYFEYHKYELCAQPTFIHCRTKIEKAFFCFDTPHPLLQVSIHNHEYI